MPKITPRRLPGMRRVSRVLLYVLCFLAEVQL